MWALLNVLPSDIRFTDSLKDLTFPYSKTTFSVYNLLWFILMDLY